MSFGGPIDSMINSNKNNQNLLKKNKRLRELLASYKTKHQPTIEKALSKEDSLRVEQLLVKIKRQKRIRNWITIILSLTLSMLIIYWILTGDYTGIKEVID